MSFGVISVWTSSSPMSDELRNEARNKYAPGVKALGASQVHFIQTSDSSFQVVTIYPDETVANSARDKQAALRAQAAGELPVKMVGEHRGDIFAAA